MYPPEEVDAKFIELMTPVNTQCTGASWTDITLESFKYACLHVEQELNYIFYPIEYKVFLYINELDRRIETGYRELSPLSKLTLPRMEGFKRVLPKEDGTWKTYTNE